MESCQRFTPAQLQRPIRSVASGEREIDAGALAWQCGGSPSGSILVTIERVGSNLQARLIYTVTPAGDAPIKYNYIVPMVATPSNLPGNDGRRWWFMCPLAANGVACNRRVHTLYLRGAWFGCRTCHNLTYTSCNESGQFDRLARLLAREMGDVPGMDKDVARLLAGRFSRRTL